MPVDKVTQPGDRAAFSDTVREMLPRSCPSTASTTRLTPCASVGRGIPFWDCEIKMSRLRMRALSPGRLGQDLDLRKCQLTSTQLDRGQTAGI